MLSGTNSTLRELYRQASILWNSVCTYFSNWPSQPCFPSKGSLGLKRNLSLYSFIKLQSKFWQLSSMYQLLTLFRINAFFFILLSIIFQRTTQRFRCVTVCQCPNRTDGCFNCTSAFRYISSSKMIFMHRFQKKKFLRKQLVRYRKRYSIKIDKEKRQKKKRENTAFCACSSSWTNQIQYDVFSVYSNSYVHHAKISHVGTSHVLKLWMLAKPTTGFKSCKKHCT